MEIFLFVIGVVAALAGGLLVYTGWESMPQNWAMIIGGGILAIIGAVVAGVTIIDVDDFI
jgi:hypothetical protein